MRIGSQHVALPCLTKTFSQTALAGLHCAKNIANVITAVTKTLTDIERSSHFRHLLGPAIRSIRNATDIFPMEILNMHMAREIVLSLMMSGSRYSSVWNQHFHSQESAAP